MLRLPQFVFTKYADTPPRCDPTPRRMSPCGGRSTLIDVGALLREDHRAVRAGQVVGEVDDPYAGERSACTPSSHERGS